MKSSDEQLVLAHVQVVARHFLAYRGTLEKLVELIRYSIGPAAPEPDAINLFLRKEETQKKLELQFECALWRSSDARQSYRLICLAFVPDIEVCRARISKSPPADACAWCLQTERGAALEQLVAIYDAHRNPIPGLLLHPACRRVYGQMADLVRRNSK